jgi:hypothetical protein
MNGILNQRSNRRAHQTSTGLSAGTSTATDIRLVTTAEKRPGVETIGLNTTGIKAWLPDMDLNHDKQIQSLLCYRYTIGQAGAARN